MNVALHPRRLDVISLCTGGFGLDHAVELAIPSARTVCMVEREAFAVAQLVCSMEAGSLAPAPIWSDARTFNGRPWRGLVDGLIGGIPCQPHSLAGKQLGEEDERDLWSTARRIIVQSGAWFVLIENVRGMLSSGGAERVWRDLHRLGFTVEGGLFTASEVGAPHERERLFILAVADPSSRGHQSGSRRHGTRSNEVRQVRISEPREHGEGVFGVGQADADCQRLEGQRPDAGAQGRPNARRPAGLCDGTALDNAICGRRPAGRDDHREHERHQPDAAGQHSLDDASIARSGTVPVQQGRQDEARPNSDGAVIAVVNTFGRGRARRSEVSIGRTELRAVDERTSGRALFPPRPDDINGWRDALEASPELEPAFRRVADGLATRLDIGRVDRLRMLGNGVVPLEGAYAIRTLATRLAARGSAAATRLVRMMEDER